MAAYSQPHVQRRASLSDYYVNRQAQVDITSRLSLSLCQPVPRGDRLTPLLTLQLKQSTARKALAELIGLPDEQRSETYHQDLAKQTTIIANLDDEINRGPRPGGGPGDQDHARVQRDQGVARTGGQGQRRGTLR